MKNYIVATILQGLGLIFLGWIAVISFEKESLLSFAMTLMFLGGVLNFLAVTTNGGQMPVFGDCSKQGIVVDPFNTHKTGDINSKFLYLCDGIKISFWRVRLTISVGDVIIGLSAVPFLFWIIKIMRTL